MEQAQIHNQVAMSRARSKESLPELDSLMIAANKYAMYGNAQKVREEGRREQQRLNLLERYRKD